MRCGILCAGLLASVAASAGTAVAADIPVRTGTAGVGTGVAAVPVGTPPSGSAPDWVGFYLGIHGGGGSANTSFSSGFFDSTTASFAPFNAGSNNGGLGGGQAGYNWQWGPVVGGLEIDFSAADLKATSTFVSPLLPTNTFSAQNKLDELASTRFRLGYLIYPTLLLYGTGGLGWGHFQLSSTSLSSATGEFTSETSYANAFGWVAGAGLEWQFAPRWHLRGEWLHYDFRNVSQFDVVPIVTNGIFTPDNVRTTVDIGRAALSYRF